MLTKHLIETVSPQKEHGLLVMMGMLSTIPAPHSNIPLRSKLRKAWWLMVVLEPG
jgi:hypothetical protein